jgi:hypothetical protein
MPRNGKEKETRKITEISSQFKVSSMVYLHQIALTWHHPAVSFSKKGKGNRKNKTNNKSNHHTMKRRREKQRKIENFLCANGNGKRKEVNIRFE